MMPAPSSRLVDRDTLNALRSRAARAACRGLLGVLLTFAAAPALWAQALSQSQGPSFGTVSIGTVEISLSATGGSGPGTYAWSVIGGSLPPGVSLLSTDLPSYFPLTASAGLIGVATTPGNYSFTLRVESGAQVADRTCTLTVSALGIMDPFDVPDAFVGEFYSHQLTALNSGGTVMWTATGGVPAGMSLTADGVLTGVPTTAGVSFVSLRLTDGVDTLFRSLRFSVFAVHITTPGVLPNAAQNADYATTVTATGGAGGYTFAACPGSTIGVSCAAGLNALPAGLVLNPSGAISGTVTAGPSSFAFTLTATDATHQSYSKVMSIDVVGVPPALPLINPHGLFLDDCTVGVNCSRGIAMRGGGTAPFTWAATGLPPGMSIRTGSGVTSNWIPPGDVELFGVPRDAGLYNVEVTVTDDTGVTSTNIFPLHVSVLDERAFLPSGTIGVPYSHRLRVIGGTPPYTVEQTGGQLPAGLTLDPSTFMVTGTPLENSPFNNSFLAILLFTDADGNVLERSNYFSIGGGTSTITINSSNLGNRTAGSFTAIQLSACCVPSLTWSHVGGTLPPGLTLSPDGILNGTPTTEGTFTFLIQAADATDPANFGIRQMTLNVTLLSITTSSLPFGNVGSPYSVTLTATGGTGSLTWTFAPRSYTPPGLTLDANGVFSGTPAASGQFSFTVHVTDESGRATARTLSISIYPAGTTPPLNLPLGPNLGPFTVGTRTFALSATGGVPPYSYSLTPVADVIPGMRVQDGPPLPSGFVATGAYLGVIAEAGTYQTSIRVTDSIGQTFDREITLTIVPIASLSQSSLPRATVGVPYSFNLAAYGGSGNYSWAVGISSFLPSGLTLSSSGQISGTPSAAGTYFPTITLTDLTTATSISFGYTLIIDPFAITNDGVLPTAILGMPYNQALAAPGCGSGCTWSVLSVLPGGLSLSADGVLSGTPTSTTNSFLRFQASGSNGITQKLLSLQILRNTPQPLFISTTSPLGNAVVGNLVAAALFAQNGQPPYTWSLQAGTLPPGINLQFPGENVGSNLGPGFTYLAGRAVQAGLFSFTLAVTDAVGTIATRDFTWDVTRLAFLNTNLPIIGNPLQYNAPYVQPLLAVGGSGNYTWANTAAMPPGLALDPATGVVSGTPLNTGLITVPIQVTDEAGNTNTSTVFFNISGPTATTLGFSSGASLGVLQRGSSVSFNVTPTGGTPPYGVTPLTLLPAGFAIQSGDSLLGTASADSFLFAGVPLATGTFSFTLHAQDSAGNIGVRSFTFSVAPFTLFTTTTLADGSVSVPYSQVLLAWDDSGPVSWSVSPTSAMPPGLNVSSAGVISGTPTQAGTYSFVLNASDSSALVRGFTFSLQVSGISITDPQILPQAAIVGVPFNYAFIAVGGASTLIWSATGLAAGLTMSPTGTVNGTTTVTGTFGLIVTVTDGVTPVSRRFALFSRNPNPNQLSFALASTALADATVGQSVSFTLSPNGGLPPYTWINATPLPPGLRLISGPDLPPNFTPGSTLLAGAPTTAGLYSFDLIATDSAGMQVRRTFTLNVSSINILAGTPRTATSGTAYAQRFLAVGGMAPYTFSMTAVSLTQDMLPPGLTLSSDGLVSGTTTSTGNYSFVLRARDAAGNTFARTYTLTVNNALGLRVTNVNPPDAWVGRGRSTLTLATSGLSTYTWSLVGGALPSGVGLTAVDTTTTLLAGAPTTSGVYTFTLRAADTTDVSNVADHTFTYRVAPMQIVSPPLEILSVLDLPSGSLGAFYSFTFRVAGGMPPYTFSESPFNPLPPGLSLTAGGILSGTPQAVGMYVIVPIISDAAGDTVNSVGMGLVVTPAGTPPPLIRPAAVATVLPDASVGAPYKATLDLMLRGGTPPFTWNFDPASEPPPGLTVLHGGNGLSDYLGGAPTVPGTYAFTLIVSDSGGQTLSIGVTQTVSSVVLSPASIPPGFVGTPYLVSLVASGGTPPYTIQTTPTSDMPPGLSLSSSGLLSGTPLAPGTFLVAVTLTDSGGASIVASYTLTIDNAAGQAPAFAVTPKPIQMYYELGSAAPAAIPVSVTTSTGALSFALSLAGVPGATLSSNTGTTNASVDLSLDVASLSAGTYVGILAAASLLSANQLDATSVTLTVTPAPPCTYGVNPSTGTVAAGGGAGSFSVATAASCGWAATVSDPSWITLTTSASGTGPATVSYTASPNASPVQRSGSITVNGQTYGVTQFGTACSFAISPANLPATSAGGMAFISVTASSFICPWTASGLSVFPTLGTGSGTAIVTIPANPDPGTRVLTATIASQTLTVTQSGIACSVSLSPYDASSPAGGGMGSVAVATPAACSYQTVQGPSWITVTSGGSGVGSGTLVYSVEPNSTTVPRSGTLSIGGQTFQITQDALPCSVTLDTSGLGSPYGPAGGAGTLGITTNGPNCSWTASSGASWASVIPASGTGPATLGVVVGSNAASTTSRSTSLTIAGQTINISQAGTTCTYSLQSSTGTVPASGGNGSVGVVAASVCGWTATSNDTAWLTITASGTGGSADVRFVAQPNPSSSPRTGSLTVAGESYSVMQAGAPCSYTLSSTNTTVASAGATDLFTFSTSAASCSPAAVSYANWIAVNTSFNGTLGSVTFTVAANPSTATRTGTIQLGEQAYTVTETGGPCGYSLNAYGAVFGQFGGNHSVLGSLSALGCTPIVSTDQPSIVNLGELSGPIGSIFTLPFVVTPFNSLTSATRLAKISFGGQLFTVKQTSW